MVSGCALKATGEMAYCGMDSPSLDSPVEWHADVVEFQD